MYRVYVFGWYVRTACWNRNHQDQSEIRNRLIKRATGRNLCDHGGARDFWNFTETIFRVVNNVKYDIFDFLSDSIETYGVPHGAPPKSQHHHGGR
jgi:hypothetical protein